MANSTRQGQPDLLRVGVSPCYLHPSTKRHLFKGKTLVYAEQSMLHWLARHGLWPIVLPPPSAALDPVQQVAAVDGLMLHGGDDVAPSSYGATARRPTWGGDPIRDRHELALIRACLDQEKPILGICRGAQILNVALGGTLLQDIGEERPGSLPHRDAERYDQLTHPVEMVAGSHLARLFGTERGVVNSVHHQAVDRVAPGCVVEARCPDDGIIEALRLDDAPYALGVQWHPEFQTPGDNTLLDASALALDFVAALRAAERSA